MLDLDAAVALHAKAYTPAMDLAGNPDPVADLESTPVREHVTPAVVGREERALHTSHEHAAQIEDCRSAVRWIRANAKKYNL